MKKIFKLIVLLTFLTLNISAQDWDLFNDTDKYNYLELNDSLIHTIWIDSISQLSNTEMFFNKTINYKRIYSDKINDTILSGELKFNVIFNQVCSKVADTLFYFGIEKDWLIKPRNKLNDTWFFSDGISARISQYYQDYVFEIEDSIKVIELSDGQTIRISKTYGIIYWKMSNSFEIELIGLDNNIGLSIPKFNDYFNYEVGDVFQYDLRNYVEGEHSGNEFEIKYSITSKATKGDTILYELTGIKRIRGLDPIDFDYHESHSYFTKESIIINSEEFFTNKNLNELINLDNTDFTFYPEIFQYDFLGYYKYNLDDTLYYTIDVRLSNTGEIIKSFYTRYYESPYRFLDIQYSIDDTLRVKSMEDYGLYSIMSFELKPKIGVTLLETGEWDNQYLQFVGAVINGDTIGLIDDDEYFIVSTKDISTPNIEVYPNPFNDRISLTFRKNSTLRIVDINGVLQYESIYKVGNVSIDLEFLDSGFYIISIIDNERNYNSLIIKE
jgi:hypothetical protein